MDNPNSSTWIPLPGWSFSGPIKQDDIAPFVKSMFRVIARALYDAFPRSLQELQFATLCKISVSENTLEFRFWAPYRKLIDLVVGHLPPEMELEDCARYFQEVSPDVHHQYRLEPDILAPVAVFYRPALGHVVFTNKNVVANPRQYLDPQLCRTTSGFLTFLGALEIHRSSQQEALSDLIVINDPRFYADKGLDQWVRWLGCVLEEGSSNLERVHVNLHAPEEYRYQPPD